MKDIEVSETYQYLVEEFGKDVIAGRFNWLYALIEEFLESRNMKESAFISDDILNHVVIDYYVDIYRLKDFQNIEWTNTAKIYSYTTYWLLRHKPIQLKSLGMEENVFINELFVTELLRSFLFDSPANVVIVPEKEEDIKEFLDTLLYFFKYRDFSAKGIEMIILAFCAGRGYQYSYDVRR